MWSISMNVIKFEFLNYAAFGFHSLLNIMRDFECDRDACWTWLIFDVLNVNVWNVQNACTLVPTVLRWHKKMEFKFHCYFSFFFGLLKWNSISISIFRFLSTCDTEKRIWISFFVFRFRRTLKRGFEFRFLFFVFSSLWKTDLNFVFRVSFSHHFGKRISMSFFVLALLVIEKQIGVFRMNLKSGLIHQSFETPPPLPLRGWPG